MNFSDKEKESMKADIRFNLASAWLDLRCLAHREEEKESEEYKNLTKLSDALEKLVPEWVY